MSDATPLPYSSYCQHRKRLFHLVGAALTEDELKTLKNFPDLFPTSLMRLITANFCKGVCRSHRRMSKRALRKCFPLLSKLPVGTPVWTLAKSDEHGKAARLVKRVQNAVGWAHIAFRDLHRADYKAYMASDAPRFPELIAEAKGFRQLSEAFTGKTLRRFSCYSGREALNEAVRTAMRRGGHNMSDELERVRVEMGKPRPTEPFRAVSRLVSCVVYHEARMQYMLAGPKWTRAELLAHVEENEAFPYRTKLIDVLQLLEDESNPLVVDDDEDVQIHLNSLYEIELAFPACSEPAGPAV